MPESMDDYSALRGLSTSHRVLRIAEIQDRIFSFNEVDDAARCALVCKAWTDVSLDHVWNTASDIVQLLNILAPLKATKKGLVR